MNEALVRTRGLMSGYANTRILREVDLAVGANQIVAVIGPNGAGKTTLARSLAGFTRIFDGDIELRGESIVRWSPDRRAANGIGSVPEGRRLFGELTVRHNLELALFARRRKLAEAQRERLLDDAYERFPVLRERGRQRASSLSGGEQQMLAIARALLLEPQLLILDEPSTGLAPIVVRRIFEVLRDIVSRGACSCLLIEQQAMTALEVADFAYVLSRGHIVSRGPAGTLREDADLRARYLGGTAPGHVDTVDAK